MFTKVVVIDAKGHLLGRLASYVAKELLSGILFLMKDKESLLLELKESILQDHFSEIKLNSPNF